MTIDKKQAALDAAGQARVPEKGSARVRGGTDDAKHRNGKQVPDFEAPKKIHAEAKAQPNGLTFIGEFRRSGIPGEINAPVRCMGCHAPGPLTGDWCGAWYRLDFPADIVAIIAPLCPRCWPRMNTDRQFRAATEVTISTTAREECERGEVWRI